MTYPIFISDQTELNHFFKSYTDILFKKNELIIAKIKKTLSVKIKSFCIEKKHNIKIKNALKLVL